MQCLRLININLKLISDIEKCQFIEITIKGGISMLCKGYAEANNKLLKLHNTNKPTSYIIYLDANNLYIYMNTMTQPLPTEILD